MLYAQVICRPSCRSGDDLSGELKLSNSGVARGKSEEIAGSYMRNMSGDAGFVCSDILLSGLTCWVMRRRWEHQKFLKGEDLIYCR